MRFLYLAAHNQFRLHPVAAYFRHFCSRLPGISVCAVACHQQVHLPRINGRAVLIDAFQQAGELFAVAVPRGVKHVLVRHEAEQIGRVLLFLRFHRIYRDKEKEG